MHHACVEYTNIFELEQDSNLELKEQESTAVYGRRHCVESGL